VILQTESGELRILYGGKEIARHLLSLGRKQRIVDPRHFDGVAVTRVEVHGTDHSREAVGELLRPLSDYEAVVGGQG
jgi:hypothetical protein